MSTGILIAIIIFAVIGVCLTIGIVYLLFDEKRRVREGERQALLCIPAAQELPPELDTAAMAMLPEPVAETEEPEGSANDFAEEDEAEVAVTVDAATGKKIYYRFNFSFKARLIQSPAEQQARYGRIQDEIKAHPKLKTSISWRQERIYSGRTWIATLLFKGRRLCMAFALDPAEFADTKYEGIDVHEVKRFERTPLLIKLTSDRKTKFCCELLREEARRNAIKRLPVDENAESTPFALGFQSTRDLIREGLVKIITNGEGEEYEKADIGELIRGGIASKIREQVSREEAAKLVTDREAQRELDAATEHAPENEPEHSGGILQAVRRMGRKHSAYINIDTLSQNFAANDRVTLQTMIERELLPPKTQFVKILARGILNKPLLVEAHDFSLDAVKMILLVGGKVKKVL